MSRPRRPARGRRRSGREAGYAAVLVALVTATLAFPLAAISVDVARWYVEIARVQSAADAAALAGVTRLPDDLPGATTAAVAAAARNGYSASGDVSVAVQRGAKSTQLKVTITSTVTNTFGRMLGLSKGPMSATSVADYNAPAPLGSPCNNFGNEPNGSPANGPTTSAIVAPSGATCPTTPQFWSMIEGPEVLKTQGDQFSTRYCQGGEDGCSGSANAELEPRGKVFVVHVAAAAVGHPITLQVYDPAAVSTGVRCERAPNGSIGSQNWNPYATTDAQDRYRRTPGGSTPNAFCTGDDGTGFRVGIDTATTTSYALRQPNDTFLPWTAPPVPDASCQPKQFPGFKEGEVTAAALDSTSPSYNLKLAAVFHQWVPVCTFTPTQAGDHYLQVRNNVALGGTQGADGIWSGNPAVTSQAGDDTTVKGNTTNAFAIRAVSSAAGSVSIAGWHNMTIYANTDSATTVFNLVRVIPASAGKTLDFEFFDVGDAASSGSMQVLGPTEYSGSIGSCKGSGVVNGALTNCQVTGISNATGWNGKRQHIRVQIPADYTCNDTSSGGCWFRVRVGFGSGTVQDVTTWSAVVEGEPVRLIE